MSLPTVQNEKTLGWRAQGGAILWGSDRQHDDKVADVTGQLVDPVCRRPIAMADLLADMLVFEPRRLQILLTLGALDGDEMRFLQAEGQTR
ncbi:MAG: hypothetical protein ACK56W_24855 [Pirellula sp.]|jgi:hypothetical protein|nr:hypothetical protein [Pirellula sp.]